MATGDFKNNLRILNSELRKLNVPSNICNLAGMSAGSPDAFLDIFDNVLQWHSPALSRLINSKGLKLPSKEKRTKFLEGVYLIFREIFSWKPPLTVAQFLSNGFHERKVIMCTEIIRLINQKTQELEQKASKKQQLMDSMHGGLNLILKQPPKGILHVKENMNVKSPAETCEKCTLLKDELCICTSKQLENPSSARASAPVRRHNACGCQASRNNEVENATIDDQIQLELLAFKTLVLNKLEIIESRISATEERLGILENTLKTRSNTTNILPIS